MIWKKLQVKKMVTLQRPYYGSMYMDQHNETLEATMAHVQQPPPSPSNYRDIYWWNEYCVTPQHGLDGTCIQKKVYFAYVPWDRVFDFLVGEEIEGMFSANSSRKTTESTII